MKKLKFAGALLLVAALAACGGGGGSAGATAGNTTPTSPTSPTDPTTPADPSATVADVIFVLTPSSIANSGSVKAQLAVTALDSRRNVVPGAKVTVAVDNGGVFLPTTSGGVTDATGQYVGHITIGGNKSDRIINATITVNGITRVASVVVSGSAISMSVVPATPTPGQLVSLNLAATDSAGTPIQSADLVLSGSAGAATTVKTSASGSATVTFNAPSVVGTYDITAKGLGVSVTKALQVVTAGGAGVPDVVETASSTSLSPQPTSIAPNAVGSTTNRSKLSAKFLTATNSGIQNMRVTFRILPPALGAGELISTGDATVYTDVNGIAEADYIAGTRSSPTNGVKVRACYKPTDFVSTDDCLNPGKTPSFKWVDATLTVAGAPLSISITDNNLLEKGLGDIAYVKKFLVQVNDSAGVAVQDAVVSASVDITHYGKGPYWGKPYSIAYAPTVKDIHVDYDPAPLPKGATRSLMNSYTAPTGAMNLWCLNEDWNRNGSLDSGEDINGDGVLQPRKAEVIVSYVNTNRTDKNGQLLVQVTYGQNMGEWLAYTLRATTSVAGSEGDAVKSYVTDVLKGDVENGSFLTPPFGSGSCRQAN